MKRFKEMILHILKGMTRAGERFPLTVLSLIGAAGIICYMISLRETPGLTIQKIMFTLLVGAVLGMAAQFAVERFEKLAKMRAVVYGVSALLTIGYFFILWPAPEISSEIGIRTFVAVFAMLCAVLWIPSFKGKTDFNKVALIHFKSIFTSVLYSGVLSGGIAAIIAAVDILLFKVNTDSYSYMLTIVWVLFATIYYLSLLPKFGSEEEEDLAMLQRSENYPKFLEILVSYIAIPLITAYTAVLIAYFVKILITSNWPSGQLGGMVLAYSAAGLVIFILASLLDNRFAVLYRKIFPKVLIPVVIMQLISVGIRLNAYGVTESRYYVALFGIFSITTAILLSLRPVSKNGLIALLAAGFAILSILPPTDAFTVSRVSQINRVEAILTTEGILADGKLTPKSNASEKAKAETTSILSYLDNRSSLDYINWLPKDFNMYEDMKITIGFEPTYSNFTPAETKYFYASLDGAKPLTVSGYDISINTYSNRSMNAKDSTTFRFAIDGKDYVLNTERLSSNEAIVSVKDAAGNELIKTGLYDFAKGIASTGSQSKESLLPENMTLDVEQNGYKLRIVFQNISITYGTDTDSGVDYAIYILFGTPKAGN
jgi:hypothetical protein